MVFHPFERPVRVVLAANRRDDGAIDDGGEMLAGRFMAIGGVEPGLRACALAAVVVDRDHRSRINPVRVQGPSVMRSSNGPRSRRQP